MAYSKQRNIYSRKSTRSWKEHQVCGIWTINCFLSTPLSIQCNRVSTLGRSHQKDSTPFSVPSSQSRATASAQEVQATSISHPFQPVLQKLYSRKAHLKSGALFFYPTPTCRVEALPQHDWSRRQDPSPQLTHRVSQTQSCTADFLSQTMETRRLWDYIFKALKEKPTQDSYKWQNHLSKLTFLCVNVGMRALSLRVL